MLEGTADAGRHKTQEVGVVIMSSKRSNMDSDLGLEDNISYIRTQHVSAAEQTQGEVWNGSPGVISSLERQSEAHSVNGK